MCFACKSSPRQNGFRFWLKLYPNGNGLQHHPNMISNESATATVTTTTECIKCVLRIFHFHKFDFYFSVSFQFIQSISILFCSSAQTHLSLLGLYAIVYVRWNKKKILMFQTSWFFFAGCFLRVSTEFKLSDWRV